MNSVCLQTGNFGGNISVADHKTSDETAQNEVATQHSTQPSSHNDNLMTHMRKGSAPSGQEFRQPNINYNPSTSIGGSRKPARKLI